MNIIPFDGAGAKLPAYLKQVDVAALNADLTAHAGGGFPVLSIKGKVFAIVRDGERSVVPHPLDPDSAATSLDVVLVKAGKGTSKVFYMKGYDPQASEKQKPDCYSNDGTAPAADATNPQSKKCATCAHNQWGSRVTDKGNSKGKACNDTVRLAVAPAGQLNDPMLLRVPPASIRALGEYGQLLAKRGVAYNMVVTKVGFDKDAESPKLTFKPVGFLDEAGYAEVQEVAESDIVADITGGSLNVAVEGADTSAAEAAAATKAAIQRVRQAPAVSKGKDVTEDDVLGAIEAAAPAPAPAPKPRVVRAAPAPAPAPEPEGDLDIDLDGISFDD